MDRQKISGKSDKKDFLLIEDVENEDQSQLPDLEEEPDPQKNKIKIIFKRIFKWISKLISKLPLEKIALIVGGLILISSSAFFIYSIWPHNRYSSEVDAAVINAVIIRSYHIYHSLLYSQIKSGNSDSNEGTGTS